MSSTRTDAEATLRRCGRCDFRGTDAELLEHADEAGHPLCRICPRSLRDAEVSVCDKCVQRTRDQLAEIVTTTVNEASRTISFSGYNGQFGADLLVMTSDGSTEGGGPDEWLTDPTPVIALLEANARGWRRVFGEPPAVEMATVTSCADYLHRNLRRAAAEHPEFDEFVGEIRTLHARLHHAAGMVDDPERAPAECFKCGGRLVRTYRPPQVAAQHRLERVKAKVNTSRNRKRKPTTVVERREMVIAAARGKHGEGLTDKLECSLCRESYTFAQYGLALRARALDCEGWVTVRLASEVTRRPVRTIRTWVGRLQITSMCPWLPDLAERERLMLVWWPDVREQAAPKDEPTVASQPQHADGERVA